MSAESKQSLRLHIWGASGLTTHVHPFSAGGLDPWRKTISKPFFKLGFSDANLSWIEVPYKPYKSEAKESTNSPRWGIATAREYLLPVSGAEYIKIEIWDKELIGKDFMGQVCIPISKITQGEFNGLNHYDIYAKNLDDRVSGKLEVEIRYSAPSQRSKIALRSKTSRRLRLKSLRTAAASYIDKLGRDALRIKILTKDELCKALELLEVPPTMNAANMFVPGSCDLDNIITASEHSQGLTSAVADVLWDVFDLNKDGEITFQEVILAVSFNIESTPEKRARFYFKIFDEDEDDVLSRSEVLRMQQMLFRLVRGFYAYAAAWKRVEGSGDEKRRQRWMAALLKASETAEISHLPETLTEEIMTTVDTNHDGSISLAEYSAFLHDLAAQKAVAMQYEILISQLKDQIETVVSSKNLPSVTPPETPHDKVTNKKSRDDTEDV